MNMQKHALRLLVALAVAISFPVGIKAQNAATQQATCDKYRVAIERCSELISEFYTAHALLAPVPVSFLDFPPTNTKAFANEIEPAAVYQTLKAGLNEDAAQAAQAALQTISTTAAVTQVGGSSGANGSTNLATKPTTTDLISLASESGAFTDTVNGTTATLQANALGLMKYMGNKPIFERWESEFADRIQPLTFAVTLNVAQSSSSTVATTGSANTTTSTSIAAVLLPANNASFSSFTASYNLYRPYGPQDKTFLANWAKALTVNSSAFSAGTATIQSAIALLLPPAVVATLPTNMKTPLDTWHTAAAAAEKTPSFDAFVAAYRAYSDLFCSYVMSLPNAPTNAMTLVKAIQSFDSAVDTVINQARGTPLATLNYTYSMPVQKPATHEFTAAVSYLFKGNPQESKPSFMSGVQLTGNFTGAIYSSVPAGATYSRLRDLQISAEVDKPFGGTVSAPRGTLSAAGYGQYQYDPTVLNITAGNLVPGTNISLPSNAQVLLGTSGWLGVVQGKLVVNLKSGLTLPIAVKWSNKTDLIQGNDVRGQVGLSYDLSALSSLITGK